MPTPASPDTNNFRCNACGRYFNESGELRAHEAECRPAKLSTESGARQLANEDREPHGRNDSDVREFKHGPERE